jgi:hypothetical protein
MKNKQIKTNFEELERILTIQNEYAQKQPKNKEQEACIIGMITALHSITDYKYTFNRQENKITKIKT